MLTPDERKAMLAEGGSALQAGRLADAIALGGRLLDEGPGDLQALYLVGVARSRRGEYEQAVEMLDRVLEREPGAAPVAAERRRAADALGRRIAEHEVCRGALPRLRRLIAESAGPEAGAGAHVVLATALIDAGAMDLARRAAAASGFSRTTQWREVFPSIRGGVPAEAAPVTLDAPTPVDPPRRAHPDGGVVMFVGAARSPAAWFHRIDPATVVLVIDEFMPCEIVARVRELSGAGRRQVALMYASDELARRTSLPGRVVRDG